jgi:hypothetical protein
MAIRSVKGGSFDSFSVYFCRDNGGVEEELADLVAKSPRKSQTLREYSLMGYLVEKAGARLSADGQSVCGVAIGTLESLESGRPAVPQSARAPSNAAQGTSNPPEEATQAEGPTPLPTDKKKLKQKYNHLT